VSASTVHELVRRAAAEHGDQPAVIDGARSITYRDLDRDSGRLAHALIAHGLRPGDRLGLFLEKSIEAVVAIYATLKAGATYVPLDDQAPLKRVAYIARDAGIHILVTSAPRVADCLSMAADGAPLRALFIAGPPTFDTAAVQAAGIAAIPWEALAEQPGDPLGIEVDDDALAYILYTSGSTGEPKGVMLSHRNCLAFVGWAAREIGLGVQDRLSSHAPFHFDLSTFDLFAAAWAAAPVVLVPRSASVFPLELARFIRDSGITVWYSVPSILTQLVLRGDLANAGLDRLRAVIFAGEVFPTKYLTGLIELLPQARYYNFYGPTETNVCTWYEVPRGKELGAEVPIGRPIPGVEALLLDETGAAVAPGEVGDLAIRGPTVMHGYWGDPERTRRVLTSGPDGRVYRTGDLVHEGEGGELRFLGRRDAQIKVRGYRVELGEIEAALNAVPDVVECAVLAIPDETVTNRLKAYVVSTQDITAAELITLCGDRLPRHMIPDEFEFRRALPKSSTGKIDRRQLQAG
jgi:amino acid adenylation domain-containing protein